MATFRDELLKDIQNCRRMLQKYEDKLLKEEETTNEREKYYMDRVEFWSGEVKDAKAQLNKSQGNVQAMN